MKIKGADFFVYYVSDLARAVGFYRDVLGLPLAILKEDWNWVEFSIPPTTLVLFGTYPGAPLQPGTKGSAGVALAVESMPEAIDELRAKNVTIADGPHELADCFVAMIVDLDGNPIFLHQRKDGTFG
jgi:catechol 2,3-dioxygenase-like lactoylglutathione lyase family enzyme